MTFTINKRTGVIAGLCLAVVLLVAACTNPGPDKPKDSQQTSQQVVEDYQKAAETAVPYPLADMQKGGWLERRLLVENLKRQNDSHRIAYVVLLNQQGQPIIQYTIQGMVFDLNSQLTTEDKINGYNCGGSNNCYGQTVTKSPGDNGTWGPEPKAIGFFTTEGVEVKWNGLYLEADSPMDIQTKPLIVYDAGSAKPSTTGGGVSNTKDGGIKTGG